MRYFDLHCDTLYRAVTEGKSLNEQDFHLSVDKGINAFAKWRQCMAVWIPDGYSDQEARKLFGNACKLLLSEANRHKIPKLDSAANDEKYSFILTVENGALIGNDISYIKHLSDCGVKMLTLTWNGENNIGGGADAQSVGLKPFGKLCLKCLEENKIAVDVSHASDRLFCDVAETATEPFLASHSNSRTVCNHRRNLTDEQFLVIRDRGGVVGLNFYKNFLNENPSDASVTDVLKHADHFLSLGGENTLSIGSDFDGAEMPADLDSIEKAAVLYESFLKIGYTEQLVQKIFYDNAYNFLSKF
ncbi:MAG: dipeptidase [Ruminococcus sp.]